MAVIRKTGSLNVVEAAKIRIKNAFSNGLPVYLSFSGGKDSLVLSHLIYTLIQEGQIDPSQLTVRFIDEEGIFPCVERTVKEWRKKFLMAGVKFEWYCIEVRHFNCLNELENDESFICWDRYKKDVWIREKPPFAIEHHPLLRPRKDTYQEFLKRIEADGITLIGNRVAESLQRLKNLARTKHKGVLYPIYDWKDSDVWRYIAEHKINFPDVYLYLYQTGITKNRLRISQFFSVDTAGVLVNMNEYYPDLMERVTRREPNAYLVALYWDSEMFRRRTNRRKKLENVTEDNKNYKKELAKLLSDIEGNFNTPHKQFVARCYKNFMLKVEGIATEKHYRDMYESLVAGDPKRRNLRAVYISVFADARKAIK